MTSEARETSVQDGEPLRMYVFTFYGTNYRYTSASEDYVYDGSTYLAFPIDHDDFEKTSEVPKNNIKLYVPHDFPLLTWFEDSPPSDVMLITIFTVHRGESTAIPEWTGRALNAQRNEKGAEIYCENVFTSLRRQGLRRTYGRNCPHDLYGTECKAQDTLFRIEVTLDSVNGLQIESAVMATYDDGRFAGGYLEWEPTPGRIERRGIKWHSGSSAEMTHSIRGLTGIEQVYLYPGCKHNETDCNDFFDNLLNYGGFNVPRLNAMGQSNVFAGESV